MTTFVKTAGMTHGTPDWQLDMMYESESAQIWEDQSFDPYPAVYKLQAAYDAILKAENKLGSAAQLSEGTPMDDRIMSILKDLEEVEIAVKKQMREMGV